MSFLDRTEMSESSLKLCKPSLRVWGLGSRERPGTTRSEMRHQTRTDCKRAIQDFDSELIHLFDRRLQYADLPPAYRRPVSECTAIKWPIGCPISDNMCCTASECSGSPPAKAVVRVPTAIRRSATYAPQSALKAFTE